MESSTTFYAAIGFMVVSNFITIALFWWFTIRFSWSASSWKTVVETKLGNNGNDINQAFGKIRKNEEGIKKLNDSWTDYWKDKAAGRH